MKAVYITEFGGPEKLAVREVPDPQKPAAEQVLIRVLAAGLNRADLLQRRGLYPPPAGYSPNIPGLEFAGEIVEVGSAVNGLQIGDRVFGITAGEAQAEFLLIDEGLAAEIPGSLGFVDAAAVPEAFITAYDAVFSQAHLKAGETLLIHSVGSGVGLAALQLAKATGVKVFGTSRTSEKLDRCRALGLDAAILAGESADFARIVHEKTDGRGVDVILDLAGGAYFEQNLKSLASKGRLMLVGLTAGAQANFNLGIALSKRLKIIGTVLRPRTIDEKAQAVREFRDNVVPLFASGVLKPNVDKVFAMEIVGEAHEYLESNESFGKVILEI